MLTYSHYGLSRDSHSAVMLPLLPPLHRRPMRRSAFIRRIFGTRQRDLKAFQYARRRRRRRRQGGAADRGGGGPFQGRNFSVGSLEKSIPLHSPFSLSIPLQNSGKTVNNVASPSHCSLVVVAFGDQSLALKIIKFRSFLRF